MIPRYKNSQTNCLQKINISNLLKNQQLSTPAQHGHLLIDAVIKNGNNSKIIQFATKNEVSKSIDQKYSEYPSCIQKLEGRSSFEYIKDLDKAKINNKLKNKNRWSRNENQKENVYTKWGCQKSFHNDIPPKVKQFLSRQSQSVKEDVDKLFIVLSLLKKDEKNKGQDKVIVY